MQSYVDQNRIAGLSTLIARKGKVVHYNQVGQMDKEANQPMTSEAIFRIYSMTKPIVCTALMTLFEQGCFRLIDPVSKFIPAFRKMNVLQHDESGNTKTVRAQRPITIRDLLTHTAGLTYDFLDDTPVNKLYRDARLLGNADRTLEAMVQELASLPLAYQPGTKWHYSFSIDVAAHLVEILANQPLRSFLKEKIFVPLGMQDTDFCIPPEKMGRHVKTYGIADLGTEGMTLGKMVEIWKEGVNQYIDLSETYPHSTPDVFARGGHGLFSTAADYFRFAQMLLNKGELAGVRILGRKTLEFMHTNHLPAHLIPYNLANVVFWNGYGYGLGSRVMMNLGESDVLSSIGEFGWSGAAKTYYWVDPQEDMIGILMSQCLGFELPEKDFQVLAYQALID
ncbi:MAG: beta-lactamase family protein [SAR324 cluster bacterium]|nr:beta-lactamase family protein [SAR324 cluster bacterium]